MVLVNGKRNIEYSILQIPDEKLINQKLLALGIYAGANVIIKQFLPAKGPIIIIAGTGEVALSYEIASSIVVKK